MTKATAVSEQVRAARARTAERMRRSRQRRIEKVRCYTLELREAEIAELVHRGFLARSQETDKAAVCQAFYTFLDRTLARPA
jgi:FixJ family two-component response regulator